MNVWLLFGCEALFHSTFALLSRLDRFFMLWILARCTIHALKGALRYRRSLRSTWGAIGSRLNSTLRSKTSNYRQQQTLSLDSQTSAFTSLRSSPPSDSSQLSLSLPHQSPYDFPSLPTFPLPPLRTTSFSSLLLPKLIFLLPSSLAPDSFRISSVPTPFPCLRIEYSPRYLRTSRSRFLPLLSLSLKLSRKGQVG